MAHFTEPERHENLRIACFVATITFPLFAAISKIHRRLPRSNVLGDLQALMALKHLATRALVSLLPSTAGLWRVKDFLPTCPEPDELGETRLRGYPIRLRFKRNTYAGWFLFYRGIYEEECVRICRRLLRNGMNFVDVGANVGLYSVIAAHIVGPGGTVLALEPQINLALLVAQNAELNDLKNIVVRTYALRDTEGTGRLYQVSRTNDGQATVEIANDETYFGEPQSVEVKTLPSVLREIGMTTVGGMKIDVEGAELEVLKGCGDLLKEQPPEFLLVECIDKHLRRFCTSSEELLDVLWSFGYQTACLHRGRWHPFSSCEQYKEHNSVPDILAVYPATPAWHTIAKII